MVRRKRALAGDVDSVKIAFTHNLRLTDSEDEAEFDSVETVDAIANGLRAGGHEVEKIEVTGPASHLAARIESFGPDLIFNTAEGRRGRTREAFYPGLFEELGYPYTGSDAYVLTVTLDKWMTKLILGAQGIDTPRARLVVPDDMQRGRDIGMLGLAFRSSSSPTTRVRRRVSATTPWPATRAPCSTCCRASLRKYPAGVLVEEFVPGTDVTVPFVEGIGDEGVLMPVDYVIDPVARTRFNIYDYRLKSTDAGRVAVRCPPDLQRDVVARLRGIDQVGHSRPRRARSRTHRLPAGRGRSHLPARSQRLAIAGAGIEHVRGRGARGARLRRDPGRRGHQRGPPPRAHACPQVGRRRRPPEPLRIGFSYNVKRVDTKGGDDTEAEYDAPETINSIRDALESYGHVVVPARGHGRAAPHSSWTRRWIWCSTSPRASQAATARPPCPRCAS